MLESLGQVDWRSLPHAGGPASDVPEYIRALVSANERVRDDALSQLFSTIWYQGTVYAASAPAVQFLVELVLDPAIKGKVSILGLLDCLATGFSENRKIQDDTREAVEAGIDAYSRLLDDDDWQTRLGAAKVLTSCTGHRGEVGGMLLERFDRETDPRVHFGLLLCLGDVGREQDAQFLQAIIGTVLDPSVLRGPEEERPSPGFLRGAAAVALSQILKSDTPVEAVRVLTETIDNPEPMDEFLEMMPWVPPDAIELACSALSLLGPERALPVLIQCLETTTKRGAYGVGWPLLKLSFPEIDQHTASDVHPPRSISSLSPLQFKVLSALVARDDAWQPPGALDLSSRLKRLGLPDQRGALRAFLQG
jgi:hypothetical protein